MPESKEHEEYEHRRMWIILALALGLTIAISGTLDLFAQGVPLGFTIPLLNEPATVSAIIYHASVIAIGIFVGILGLKELVIEEDFQSNFSCQSLP